MTTPDDCAALTDDDLQAIYDGWQDSEDKIMGLLRAVRDQSVAAASQPQPVNRADGVPAGWTLSTNESDGRAWLTVRTPHGAECSLSAAATIDEGRGKTIAAQVLNEFGKALKKDRADGDAVPVASYRRGVREAFDLANMINSNRIGNKLQTAEETCACIVRSLAELANGGAPPASTSADVRPENLPGYRAGFKQGYSEGHGEGVFDEASRRLAAPIASALPAFAMPELPDLRPQDYYANNMALWNEVSLRKFAFAYADRVVVASALPAQDGVTPEGWKLVPVVPTEEMIEEGCDIEPVTKWNSNGEILRERYKAMIAAAPALPAAQPGEKS